MRSRKLLMAMMLIVLAGCRVGTRGRDLPVATRVNGAKVALRVSSGSAYTGELLAVQDDGPIIWSGKIMFAPFSSMAGLTVDRMGRGYRLAAGETPRAEKLARLRAVSRFPQGLSPEIRSRLLAQTSQNEIPTIQ
ncbi:MAG: hypothetical protein ABIW94_10230 [Gemmatimonadaceae bacterium]